MTSLLNFSLFLSSDFPKGDRIITKEQSPAHYESKLFVV
jgi:hypothetical protein